MHNSIKIVEKKLILNQYDDGSVIVFFALISLVIISLFILAAEPVHLLIAKTQQETIAISASHAALKTHYTHSGTESNKVLKAKKNVLHLLNSNKISGDKTSTYDIGLLDDEQVNGFINPSTWFNEIEVDENEECLGETPCPCVEKDGTKVWAGSCFQEKTLNDVSSENIKVNSYKINLKTSISHILAQIIAGDKSEISSTARIVGLPMKAVFLLDLSRFSHLNTHTPYELLSATETNVSESAYRISNSCSSLSLVSPQPCGYTSSYPSGCGILNAQQLWAGYQANSPLIPKPPTQCDFLIGEKEVSYGSLWNFFCDYENSAHPPLMFSANPGPIKQSRGTTQSDNTKIHFKDDYSCINVTYKRGEGVANSPEEYYLVDTYRFAGDTDTPPYKGPQPLSSFLEGINYGLRQISARKVPDDATGILGYDFNARVQGPEVTTTNSETGEDETSITPLRKFDLTAPVTDNDDSSETMFEKLLRYTNTDPNLAKSQIAQNLRESFFFPRIDSSANIPQALRVAYEMLMEGKTGVGSTSFKHIFLFTTGLSNCLNDGTCGEDEILNYQASINEVVEQVAPDLNRFGIKLHIFMIGNRAVGSHKIIRKSLNNENKCMDDYEAREKELNYVDHMNTNAGTALKDALSDASAERYFYPNKLYQATATTNGTWAPILPQCTDQSSSVPEGDCSNVDNCTYEEIDKLLNRACKDETADDGIVKNLTMGGIKFTDGNGRLLCSPLSVSKQIQDYVDQIIFSEDTYLGYVEKG